MSVAACKDCGGRGYHDAECNSLSIAERYEMLVKERKTARAIIERQTGVVKRLREMVTLWQGKHALLRHENNKLRNKVKRDESRIAKEMVDHFVNPPPTA